MFTRALRSASAGAVLLAASLPIASCVQVLGIRELPGDVHVARCGSVRYADEACAKCTDEQCCGEAEACAADADCSAQLGCVSRCSASDVACRLACGHLDAAPGSPLGDLESCRGRRCTVACTGCAPDSMLSTVDAECATCFAAKCCEVLQSCAADAGCWAHLSCQAACTDPICVGGCGPAAEGGAYGANIRCYGACPACELGRRWACVGNYTDHIPDGGTATVRATFRKYGQTGVEGLAVKLCSYTDLGCDSPAGTPKLAYSDTSGTVVFTVDVPATSGFTGYLDVRDGPSAAESVAPTLFSVSTALPMTLDLPWPIFDAGSVEALSSLAGETFDPAKNALVVMETSDCAGASAPDIVLEAVGAYAGVHIYPLYGNVPNLTATSTDNTGFAIAVVTPTPDAPYFMYQGSVAPIGLVGTGAVPLRAGALSGSILVPKAQ